MAINEEICDFDKWKMFGKRVDKATNKAMMDHQGNNKDTTSMDVSNTNAVTNFLQVSEQIERHHAQMWTRQQKGAVGDKLETLGKKDAQAFTDILTRHLNTILKNVMGEDTTTTPDANQMKEIKKQKKIEVNKVMDELAKKECDELGDEAPSKSHISEPLQMLKAWIGRRNMRKISEECINRPQDCSWIPQCKRFKLQEECDDSGKCTNACTRNDDEDSCVNSPHCIWLEAPEPELEQEETYVTPVGKCV